MRPLTGRTGEIYVRLVRWLHRLGGRRAPELAGNEDGRPQGLVFAVVFGVGVESTPRVLCAVNQRGILILHPKKGNPGLVPGRRRIPC
jgi:hypothetical protein